jgi:MFS family permease
VLGFGISFVSIPVLPEMLDAIEEDEALAEEFDRELVENITSGLFISFGALGEAIGPVVSAHLAEAYGFQTAQEIYTVYLIVFIFSYFIMCGMCSGCGFLNSKAVEEEEDEVKMLFGAP